MRKQISLLLISFAAFSLYSCQKEIKHEAAVNNNMASKIDTWLETQKPTGKATQSANIDLLKNNLDFANLRIENSSNNERIIVVPIKDGLKTEKGIDPKAIPNLLLIEDKNSNFRKANIVLFFPKDGTHYDKVPDNTFYAILNTGKPECNGTFKYLSLTGNKMHELSYENEHLKSFGHFKKPAHSGNTMGRMTMCVDWYWVYTQYDEYGSVIDTWEEYIGTTCEGEDCEDPFRAAVCPMNNIGEGSGVPADYEFTVTKPKVWTVETNQNQAWYVKSYETLTGIKNANEPYGGHFTSNTHDNSAIFGATSGPFASVWTELQRTSNLDNNNVSAYTIISGRVSFPNTSTPPQEITNKLSDIWYFFNEFP